MKKIVPEFVFTAEQAEAARAIASRCGLHELTARILFARGVDTEEKVRRFLSPSRKHFLSPFRMRGMRELVDRLSGVRDAGGMVAVFGDYDADGIGAAAILTSALRQYGVRCAAHIPERTDGYGMSVAALETIIDEHKPDLIVTVDCGVSNREEVAYIRSRGVDVVVTDHHELPPVLPDCVVINPKLADDYPYDNLCGAGVAFKVACALLGEDAYPLLDLAAVSTVADSVPLTGENRDIVFEGLRLINTRPREALRCLLATKKEEITAQTLAFTVAPRINAAGRMGDADCALRLFTSRDKAEIYDLACRLNAFNLERQQICDEVYRSAKEKIAAEGAYRNIIMLSDESWNAGIVGIVAARLVEEFNRPAILFVPHGDCLKGSARTIESVNIYEALKACSEHIAEFGGHAQAAGVNIRKESFGALRSALDEYIGKTYSRADLEPTLGVCSGEGVSFDIGLAEELERLEPCGVGNRKPLFAIECEHTPARRLKDGSPHLSVRADGLDLVWFGGEAALPLLSSDIRKTLVFECGVSRFRGEKSVRGVVRDMVCKGGGGSVASLYGFRNALLRMKGPSVPAEIEWDTTKGIRARIRAAREACRYGLLMLCSEGVPAELSDCADGLECDLFRLSSHNVGNAVLVAPAADADIALYRDVIWLDTPAAGGLRDLAGRKVVVNREIDGAGAIRGLDTSREAMSDAYRAVRVGLTGEDSVAAALSAKSDLPVHELIFAIEVFVELGLLRFDRGRLAAVRGKKSDLGRSALYTAVCRWKEKK